MTQVRLIANKKEWRGFKSLSIKKSMDSVVSAATFTTSDGRNDAFNEMGIRPDSEIEIYFDQQLAFEGVVRRVKPSIGPDSHNVSVEASSRSIDLVEASHTGPWFWKNVNASTIVDEVLEPFGMDYSIDGEMINIGKTGFRASVGATAFSIVKTLADKSGLTVYLDSDQKVRITKEVSSGIFAGINTGQFISMEADHDGSQSFSELIVKAQQNSTKKDFAGKQQVERTFQNSLQERYRPLVLVRTGKDSEQEKFLQMAKRRLDGKSITVGTAVTDVFAPRNQGGSAGENSIWQVNKLIHVADDSMYVDDVLLCHELTFSITEGQGLQTSLSLRLPETYSDETPSRSKSRRASGDFGRVLKATRNDDNNFASLIAGLRGLVGI